MELVGFNFCSSMRNQNWPENGISMLWTENVGVSSKSKCKIKITQLLEYDRHSANSTNLDCWVDILNKHNIQPANILSGILRWQNFACILNTPLLSNFFFRKCLFFLLVWVQIPFVTVTENVWYFWSYFGLKDIHWFGPINWYVFRWCSKRSDPKKSDPCKL